MNLRPWSFLPDKGANDGELDMARNMPRRCRPPPHPANPPLPEPFGPQGMG